MPLRFPQFSSHIVLLLCCSLANASGGLFDSDEILEIELRGPLRDTLRDTRKRNSRPFVLEFGAHELDVEVRVRGHSRVEACTFPPLRLDFSGASAMGTPFAGQGELKLVTHCRNGAHYEQNLLEEYAAYRIFSLFTDTSFRVRLLRVLYVDTGSSNSGELVRYAFLIESKDELARRVGGALVETESVYKSQLHRRQTSYVFVFQFLIGNTDWSLVRSTGAEVCCHNGELLELDGEIHYVPYDFDQAGIVNARYAEPHPGLRLGSVKTRRYRGNCVSGLELEEGVRTALDLEGPIGELLSGLPDSDEKLDRARQKYVGQFFERARNPRELATEFEKHCVD